MIAAFAPATVSNVAAGFDVLGFALEQPGDIVVARLADAPGVVIGELTGEGGRLSRDPGRNTAGAAVQALLAALGTRQGIVLDVHKGLPLASGVGSSGASAVCWRAFTATPSIAYARKSKRCRPLCSCVSCLNGNA